MDKKHKSTVNVLIIAQMACLGAFNYGYIIAELTIAYSQLAIAFGIDKYKDDLIYEDETPDQYTSMYHSMQTVTTVVMLVGALVSCYIGKFILNRVGRREFMMLSDVVICIGSSIGLISNLYSFLVARFLMGFGVGMNTTVVPLYVKEMSPDAMSGLTGSFFQINVNLGIILVNAVSLVLHQVVSNYTSVQGIWRLIIILPAVFSAIRLLALLLVYKKDTPFYYYLKGQKEEGTEALKQIYKDEFISELQDIMNQNSGTDASSAQQNDETKTSSYRNRLILGVFIQLFQQMTGINAVVQFASSIFSNITSDYNTINYLILSSNIFLMFAAFLGSSLSVRFGRKTILLGGYFSCAILLLTFGIIAFFDVKEYTSLQIVSIIIIFIFYGCFNSSLGPVTWILNSDIVKAEGISYSVLVNWLGNITSTLMNLNPLSQINFLIFGGFTFMGFLFLTKFGKETKDKSYPEIQELYSSQKEGEQQVEKQLLLSQ